jgi:hypothetical protein
MRDAGARDICNRCWHNVPTKAGRWPDHVWLSDIEPRFSKFAECSCSSATQAAISCEGTVRRGVKGLIVPAKTIRPSRSLVRAKFFASASVSKVEVRRGLRGLGRAPGLTSTVTYQVGDISDPQERLVHWAANHGGTPKEVRPQPGID